MTSGPLAAIAPGAAGQLGGLLATVAGAALVAVLARGLLRLRQARSGSPVAAVARGGAGQPPLRAVLVRRLLAAVLLLAPAMVAAPAIRQLWPHPALGARLLVIWLLVLLLPAGAWLLTRVGDDSGRPRS